MDINKILPEKVSVEQTNPNITLPSNTSSNLSADVSKYDYRQAGVEVAGKSGATANALAPALDAVILKEKERMKHDAKLQEEAINQKKTEIEQRRNEIASNNEKITNEQKRIEQLEKQKADIKEGQGSNMPKIQFWIGFVIVVALAIYLFVFYSSASFSAFFRDSDTLDVGNAMFYSQAYAEALNESFGEFLLILFMPVIFLGLGFLIHGFLTQEGKVKYVKVAGLYFVTFIFDALLAFEISEKLYSPTLDAPNYTMTMAFQSPNFWVIIFAGFIAYVIWGLVFDYTLDQYDESHRHSHQLHVIDHQIQVAQNNISALKQNNSTLNNKIAALQSFIRSGSTVILLDPILQALTQFYNGWIQYMNIRGLNPNDCKTTYEAKVDALKRSFENQQ